MNEEELLFQKIANEKQGVIGYFDKDVAIVDDVEKLAKVNAVKMSMNAIVYCAEGKAQLDINETHINLRKNQVVILPVGMAISGIMSSPDLRFKALFLSNAVLQEFLREKISVWNEVLYIHKMHVVSMNEEDMVTASHFYDILCLCLENKKNVPYSRDMVLSLLRSAILALCGTLKMMVPLEEHRGTRHQGSIFQRFLDLLSSTPVKHRPVDYYASQLCISPKYLSVICKKNSGRSASDWITELVLEDIRYYLRNTDLNIKQVCDRTGFPNASFFGRFVREHFGCTPNQLRNR